MIKYTNNVFVSLLLLFGLIGNIAAQDNNKEIVWYCSAVASSGLTYENNQWKSVDFKKDRYMIKQNGAHLVFPDKMGFTKYKCKKTSLGIISCHDTYYTFAFNTKSKKATMSKAFGWILGGLTATDTMSVSALECETF